MSKKRVRKDVKRTGLFYHGNKYRVLRNFLMDLLPLNIDTFIDVFAGSGTIAINVNAKEYILNDSSITTIGILKLFKELSPEEIIYHIESQIEKYNLTSNQVTTHKYLKGELLKTLKSNFYKFRDEINITNYLDLYTLHFFSFAQSIRINSQNKLTSAFGNSMYRFDKDAEMILNSCKFFNKDNVKLLNLDFNKIDFDKHLDYFNNNFVYFDPPYIKTDDWYVSGYNKYNDYEMMIIAEELHRKGVKIGISNNIDNEELLLWAQLNNFNVEFLEYYYTGMGARKTKEVYIYNYEVNKLDETFRERYTIKDIKIFEEIKR